MPAKSSPITAGWPRRSNASPANFPASSMIANTVKKRATSIPPAAPRTRSRPAAKAHGGRLKRLRRLGMEVEGVVERSEEHTSELQSRLHLVCRLLLEKKKKK